jgi:hypothetical protein
LVASRYTPATQFVGNIDSYRGRLFVTEPRSGLHCFRFDGATEDDPPTWVVLYGKPWQRSISVEAVAAEVAFYFEMFLGHLPRGHPKTLIGALGDRWAEAIVQTGGLPHMRGSWQELFAPEIATIFRETPFEKVRSSVSSALSRLYKAKHEHGLMLAGKNDGDTIIDLECEHDEFASGTPKVYDFSIEVATIRVLATYTKRDGAFHRTSVSKDALSELLSVGSFIYANTVIQLIDDPLFAGRVLPRRQLVDSASEEPTKRRPRRASPPGSR